MHGQCNGIAFLLRVPARGLGLRISRGATYGNLPLITYEAWDLKTIHVCPQGNCHHAEGEHEVIIKWFTETGEKQLTISCLICKRVCKFDAMKV